MGINIQNLSRGSGEVSKKLPRAIELVSSGDLDGIKREFKTPPLDVVGSLLRSVFIAPKGKKLCICDLSAIESRVSGYVARDEEILNIFRKGLDPYLDFAARMYGLDYRELTIVNEKGEHKPKDDDAKEKRQIAKPGFLGCVAHGTPVLTDLGWIPIQKVTQKHLVFDGLTFVSHCGIVYKGDKEVLESFPLTPDHKVLISDSEWNQACGILNTQFGQQALDLAIGKLLNLLDLKEITGDISAYATDAEKLKKFFLRIWKQEIRHPAFLAPIKEIVKKREVFISNLNTSREMLLTVLLTAIMRFCRAVAERDERHIVTQGEELLVNFQMYTVLFGTLSHWMDLITPVSIWIEKITTDITKKETSDSFPTSLTQIIKKVIGLWSGMANCFQLQDSGLSTALSIEMLEQLEENLEKDFLPSRLSESRKTVEEPTYDIVDAGPRNRFTILTKHGPFIIHNCCYMLSGGEEVIKSDGDKIFTGLMGYGRAMGIPISKEDADLSVQIYRNSYKGVVRCWYDLEHAATRCIQTGQPEQVGPVRFELQGDVLKMVLPSGRCLHYLEPKIVEREWFGGKKQTIECWGVDQKKHIWTRIYTYGGKLIENAVQAISRDILANGMFNAVEMGFDITMHCHDEIVAEIDTNSKLGVKELRECMIKLPWWRNDKLLVDAAGFESDVYRKD